MNTHTNRTSTFYQFSPFKKAAAVGLSALLALWAAPNNVALAATAENEPTPPVIKKVGAAQAAAELDPSTYAPHQAIAYVVDSPLPFATQAGTDPLSRATTLMTISNGTAQTTQAWQRDAAEQAGVSAANVLSSGSAALLGLGANSPSRIVLVQDDTLSTVELIEQLENDPRVVFIEPNYVVDTADGDSSDADEEMKTADKEEADPSGDLSAASTPDDEYAAAAAALDGEDPSGKSNTSSATAPEIDLQEVGIVEAETENADAEGDTPVTFDYANTPSLADFQWGFYSNGALAGTFDHAKSVDMRSANWANYNVSKTITTVPALNEVIVAVIDTGIDATNPDLMNAMWTGGPLNLAGSGGTEDKNGFIVGSSTTATSTTGITDYHGTQVAGLIGASWDGRGMSGLASNVKLMSVRYDTSTSTSDALLTCFKYLKSAVEAGVKVQIANCSLTLPESNAVLMGLTEIGEAGITSVFASGNDSKDYDNPTNLIDPVTGIAACPYTVVVDALNPDGTKAPSSAYGAVTTHLMAPGTTILSTTGVTDATMQYMGEADPNALIYDSFDSKSRNTLGITNSPDGVFYSGSQDVVTRVIGKANTAGLSTFDGDCVGRLKPGTGTTLTFKLSLSSADAAVLAAALEDESKIPDYLSIRIMAKASAADTVIVPALQSIELPTCKNKAVVTEDKTDPANPANPVTTTTYEYDEDSASTVKITGCVKDSEFGTAGNQYYGCYYDLNEAYKSASATPVNDDSAPQIDWEHFSVTFNVAFSSPVSDVWIDSVGLGSTRVAYQYASGTSMAAPAVTGAAACIAGLSDIMLPDPGTAARAEALAAYTKASGQHLAKPTINGASTATGTTTTGAPANNQTNNQGQNNQGQNNQTPSQTPSNGQVNNQSYLGTMDATTPSTTTNPGNTTTTGAPTTSAAGTISGTVSAPASTSNETLTIASPYSNYCATGAFSTVDGIRVLQDSTGKYTDYPGPAIVSVKEKRNRIEITGYFMDATTQVALQGDYLGSNGSKTRASYKCKTLNFKVDSKIGTKGVLTVEKPEGYAGGTDKLTAINPTTGRFYQFMAELTKRVNVTLYEDPNMPVPEAMTAWPNWDLVGFNKFVFLMPRSTVTDYVGCNSLYRYNKETDRWKEIIVPLDELDPKGQIGDEIIDMSACTVKGKLLVQLTGTDGCTYATMTGKGVWKSTGIFMDGGESEKAPSFATLCSDGTTPYLFGGMYYEPERENYMSSAKIVSLDITNGDTKVVGQFKTGRIAPRVTYSAAKKNFLLCGGVDNYTGQDAQLVKLTKKSSNTKITKINMDNFVTEKGPHLYAGGALKVGYLLVGPWNSEQTANDASAPEMDTYWISGAGNPKAYTKAASEETLTWPAAVAYNNTFYVVGVVPTEDEEEALEVDTQMLSLNAADDSLVTSIVGILDSPVIDALADEDETTTQAADGETISSLPTSDTETATSVPLTTDENYVFSYTDVETLDQPGDYDGTEDDDDDAKNKVKPGDKVPQTGDELQRKIITLAFIMACAAAVGVLSFRRGMFLKK